MKHVEEAEPDMQRQLGRAVFAAILPALRKLAQAAQGEVVFGNDHELRACVAISRLAPLLFMKYPEPKPKFWPYHPDHSPEEVARLLALMHEGEGEG